MHGSDEPQVNGTKWFRWVAAGLISLAVLGGIIYNVVDVTPKIHKLTGITEIYFYNYHSLVVYSMDPATKEYKVEKISEIGKPRLFIDRGGEKGPDEVIWTSDFWGQRDVKVHVSNKDLLRGDLVP